MQPQGRILARLRRLAEEFHGFGIVALDADAVGIAQADIVERRSETGCGRLLEQTKGLGLVLLDAFALGVKITQIVDRGAETGLRFLGEYLGRLAIEPLGDFAVLLDADTFGVNIGVTIGRHPATAAVNTIERLARKRRILLATDAAPTAERRLEFRLGIAALAGLGLIDYLEIPIHHHSPQTTWLSNFRIARSSIALISMAKRSLSTLMPCLMVMRITSIWARTMSIVSLRIGTAASVHM